MSKAVLVIDMPKRCKDCFRYRADAWFGGRCTQAKDENGWSKKIEADEEYDVQNWCPLRPYQETIPVEWLERKLAEHWYVDYDIRELLDDWEKENQSLE